MEELAQVYARSLFEVAREQGKLDAAARAARPVRRRARRATASWLCSSSRPTSPPPRSRTRSAAARSAPTRRSLNFLSLLIENHRMPVIFRIRQQYERLWEEENKTLPGRDHKRDRARPGDHREPRQDDRRARRAQGHARRARGPRHPRRHRREGRQLDPRRLYPQPDWSSCAGTLPKEPLRTDMQINPDEITSILKSRIEGLDAGRAELTEVGTVLSVADGIARLHGLENCMSFEMLELPPRRHRPRAEPRVRQRRRGAVRRLGADLRGRHRQAHRRAARRSPSARRCSDGSSTRSDARSTARARSRSTETRPAEFKAPGRRPAPAGQGTDADGAEGDRRDDPDRPRPARAHHRRPPDGQDGDRDRHDHQQQGHRRGLGLRGDRPAHVDRRRARADARGKRRAGEHDHRRRARRRGRADQVHGPLRRLRDGRALPLQRPRTRCACTTT